MINIGGKERHVEYNFNAIIEFEELTGIDLTSNNDKQLFTKVKNIRALAFCGLKHGALVKKEPVDFTLEDVGAWLNYSNMSDILNGYVKDSSTGEDSTGEPQGEAKK